MHEPVFGQSSGKKQGTKSRGKVHDFTTKACTGQAGSGKVVIKEKMMIHKDAEAHEEKMFQGMIKAKKGNKTVQVV